MNEILKKLKSHISSSNELSILVLNNKNKYNAPLINVSDLDKITQSGVTDQNESQNGFFS